MADRDILPSHVKPSNYDVSLYDLELGGSWSYKGKVDITIEIKEPTKEIIINSNELLIHEVQVLASVGKRDGAIKASNISFDEKSHRAFFKFDTDLAPAKNAVLHITYSGTINNKMAGFYRSRYKPLVEAHAATPRDSEHHYQFSTQFEACDARRALPCFDEPNLKASFDFEIEIPEGLTAVSNMPEKGTRKGSKPGLQVVSFERTPIMSTYLLAWAFGDLEYVEDFTKRKYNGKNIPVRVYTTRGLKEQGRFALENAHKIIDMFSEIFDIEYPLPKSDLIAIHEYTQGAMENWGLVTYRTTAVLFDEEKSDQSYKNRIAYVVAHELAHMWFGNLVTMDWWDELWLNEAFATLIGWVAIDRLYPEWNIWGQFVTDVAQRALVVDAVRSSHPIQVPVRDALEVDQIFDAISYLKGSSVLRMLSSFLGEKTFLKGVSDYLKANAYGNATTDDLWRALSKASGKDVNNFMNNWVKTIGYPAITVAEEPGQLGVRQRRFLSTGDVNSEESKASWWVPLALQTGSKAVQQSQALTSLEETIRDVDENFYKINKDQVAFYRTNYPPARLAKLGEAKDKLSVEDKIGLIGDAAALAVAGEGTTPALLAFLENFQSETNCLVWRQILSSLGDIRSIFADNQKVSAALRKFTLKLVTPATERLGWSYAAKEDFLTQQLRALLISSAGLAGHQGVVNEAQLLFDVYSSGKDRNAIHPNLRLAVFRIAVTEGGKKAYEAVKNEFLTTDSVDGREIGLLAMGRVQSPELAKDYIEFLLSDHVPVQDIHSGSAALAANGKVRLTLWHTIRDEWDKVYGKISANSIVTDRFLRVGLNKFADAKVGEDIAAFFKTKDTRGYNRSLDIIDDTIKGNAKYKERDEALVLEWLSAHGYA